MHWTSSAIGIILGYVVFGSLWILLSDQALALLTEDTAQLARWQQYKGLAFIVITALLLYGVLALRQRQLAQSEARLRLFIEHAPAALAMLDTELRFMVVSRRWLDDYGMLGEDLTGRWHYEAFPEIPQRWREVHQRALRGAVLSADNDSFIRPDGAGSGNAGRCGLGTERIGRSAASWSLPKISRRKRRPSGRCALPRRRSRSARR